MADPYVRQSRGKFTGSLGSTAAKPGDMMYFDGTNWDLADADDNTKYAEAIALSDYPANQAIIVLCRDAVIVDTDAPYTQGSTQFLSATAGAITETRPTGAENLIQTCGVAISTKEVHAQIKPPHEATINLTFPYTVNAAPQDRDNDFLGVGFDDTSAECGSAFEVPGGFIDNVIARLWWCGTGTILDASDTYTIDVSGGIDDETTSATQDGITAAALTVAANDLANANVSAAFDGTGLMKPGNVIGVAIKKAAEGSGGDDPIMLCLTVVVRCVD
jgi:hypothetical protein